jgi:hypothetical protein
MPATGLGCHPRTSSTDLLTSTLHRKSLSRPGRHIRGPADLVGRPGRHIRGPADLAGLADPDQVAPASRVDPAVLEGRAAPADLEDTSLAAQAGAADMALADLVGMNLVVQVDRVAPPNQVGMSPVVQVDRVALADRDLGQNRALLDRNPVHPRRPAPTPAQPRRLRPDPDPTWAPPHRMRARPHLHRTPARPQERTHPEVANHRPVPIHPAEQTHLAEVIRPVEATHPAEEATHEADTEGVTLHYRVFSSPSHGFESAAANCIGARMNN